MNEYGKSITGAMRESIGTKIKTNLVPYEAIAAMAVALNYGEEKYEARNFEKGLSYTDLLESLKRHIKALEDGEEVDKDSGLPHYTLIASSTAMLCHNIIQGVVIDDRPVKKEGKTVGEISKEIQEIFNERVKVNDK